jgi:hypothetical protein
MRRPMRTRAMAIAAASSLAFSLAGCGSDEDATADETSPVVAEPADTEPADAAPDTEPPATDPPDTENTDAAASDTDSPTTDAPATGGAGYDDPCELLVGVDLDALLGEPVGTPEGELNDIADMCSADMVNEESRGSVALSVTTNSAADNYVNLEELFGVDTEISGLGDQAFHSGPYVVVLAGDTLVNFQVIRDAAFGLGVPDPDMEVAAAQILANLAG